ncbi:MAG TPA: glycosyltransferase family 4 protein [Coleofasciculaceae cyanobacterium]
MRHSKQIKLSIITQFYPPDYAATGQLIEELAVQLGLLGLSVQVFTGQPGYAFHKESAPATECSGQVVIRRSRATRIWSKRIRGKAVNGLLFCVRSGLYLLKTRSRGDILLLTTAPPFLPILGYLANKLFGIPYVCLLYDLYPDVAVELKVISRHHWLVRLWDALNCRIWKHAQQLIVLSPSMKDRVVAKCPDVIDKIAVIHNWADPKQIVPIAKHQNSFAKAFNLVDTFTVLYSGNMGCCHDLETILEAAILLKQEPIQFVFIGNGAKRQAFRLRANQLGLCNCQFLPYQDKQNLPYSLTACDLSLVSVSPGMEGLVAPSKLYAALAAGRPVAVICEQHSYLRALVNDAQCGKAFSNGDASGLAAFIKGLAADPQLIKQMGQAGRSYLLSYFTPELIAKQYSKVLCEAVFKQLESSSAMNIGQVTGDSLPIRKET